MFSETFNQTLSKHPNIKQNKIIKQTTIIRGKVLIGATYLVCRARARAKDHKAGSNARAPGGRVYSQSGKLGNSGLYDSACLPPYSGRYHSDWTATWACWYLQRT